MNKKFLLSLVFLFTFFILIIIFIKNIHADNSLNVNDDKYTIFLKSRQFVPDIGITDTLKNKIKFSLDKKHVLVQFGSIPNEEEKLELEKDGLKLLDYIPSNTWLASIDPKKIDHLISNQKIKTLTDILPKDKLSPSIKSKNYIIHGNLTKLIVEFFKDTLLEDAKLIVKKYNAQVIEESLTINTLIINIPVNQIDNFINEESVMWIEQELPFSQTNDGARNDIGVNKIQSPPYNLSGKGITVMVFEDMLINYTHPDFGNRVTIGENYTGHPEWIENSILNSHATHVAGTLGGDGNLSNGTYRGMAPSVNIVSYSVEYNSYWYLYNDTIALSDVDHDFNESINKYNVSIITVSVAQQPVLDRILNNSCDLLGDYSPHSQLVDNIIYNTSISITWAASNQRNKTSLEKNCGEYYTLSPSSTEKNSIIIGAVYSDDNKLWSSSSFGPTNDGRIKPDLVAPGCQNSSEPSNYGSNPNASIWSSVPQLSSNPYTYYGKCGTSMATPVVAGVVALIQEDWKRSYNYLPLSSTIKAILLETAKDLNNTGPDYASGFGLVNATSAINIIDSYNEDNNDIVENSILQKDSYTLNVPSNKNELKITLVWEDYPGTPLSSINLVNDLDLVIKSPNGTRVYPWTLDPSNPGLPAVRNKSDHINNVEQVYINTSG